MAKFNFKKIQEKAMAVAGLVAGSVAGNYASTAIDSIGKGKVSPMVNAGILIVASAALPSLVGGSKKGGFIDDFSNGMMAQAGVKLAIALKIPGIHGVDMDSPISDYLPSGSMGASTDTKVLSGASN